MQAAQRLLEPARAVQQYRLRDRHPVLEAPLAPLRRHAEVRHEYRILVVLAVVAQPPRQHPFLVDVHAYHDTALGYRRIMPVALLHDLGVLDPDAANVEYVLGHLP